MTGFHKSNETSSQTSPHIHTTVIAPYISTEEAGQNWYNLNVTLCLILLYYSCYEHQKYSKSSNSSSQKI